MHSFISRSAAPATMAMAAMLTIAAAISGCASRTENAGNATALIDGANGLQNWTPIGSANWRTSNEAIEADAMTTPAGGYLVSKQSYKDFRLHAEFWVSSDAKSGVFLRCADPKNITSITCYEVQIYDQRPDQTYGTGAIVAVSSAASPQTSGGKWNTYDITAKGSHLTVVLNGVKTVEVDNDRRNEGPLILQYRGGIAKYRQLRIQPL